MKVKNFLKGKGGVYSFMAGALVVLLLLAGLPACAPAVEVEEAAYEKYVSSLPEGCEPVPRECFEQAIEEGQINIYDWAEWWPEEIYSGFSEAFGIKITRDVFGDIDEALTKFKLSPEIGYDYTLPEPRVFMQMKELDLLQKINWHWLPNVNEYLADMYREADMYESGCPYGVPSEANFMGIAYNPKFIDPSDPRMGSWALILEGEEYAGRMTMMNDMYNVIGNALQYLGYSYSSDDEEELGEARDLLLRQKPWVMSYDSWPKRPILEEEAWMAQMWTGDALYIKDDFPTLEIVIPEEGSLLVLVSLVIPKGSTHPAAAHCWINYLYRPQVYAALMEAIKYTPCNTAAVEFLPEEIRELPTVQIPEEVSEKCESIQPKAFTGKGLELRSEIWEELKR